MLTRKPALPRLLSSLAVNIRGAAKAQKLGINAFRVRHGFPVGTFYGWLRGEAPKTLSMIRRLQAAGVAIPPEFRISA